jgi:DNA-binding PadR family transcriptional regulator
MTPTLGSFEHVVLLAVLHLGEEAYAVSIREEIERRTGGGVARGAVYTTLMRLEGKGMLRSRMGDPTPVRGGRAKRFYALSPAGAASLREARSALLEAWPRSARLLEERGG